MNMNDIDDHEQITTQALGYTWAFFLSNHIRLQEVHRDEITWLVIDEQNGEIGRIRREDYGDMAEWTMWEPARKFDPEHPKEGRTWKFIHSIEEEVPD